MNRGYYVNIKVIKNNLVLNKFLEEIKKATWSELYNFNNQTNKLIYNYFFDYAEQKTVFAIKLEDNKIIRKSYPDDIVKFSSEIEVNKAITTFNEQNQKKFDKLEILGIYQNKTLIYIWTRYKIYVYKFNSTKIIQEWDTHSSESFTDLYIYANNLNATKDRYHLFFLTNRNVYCTKVESNFETYLFEKADLIIKINNATNSYKV